MKLFHCMEYLFTLNSKVEKLLKWRKEIMASVQDLTLAIQAKDEEIKAHVAALAKQIEDLQAKNGATPADLDTLLAAVKAIGVEPAPVVVPPVVAEPAPVTTPVAAPVVTEPAPVGQAPISA